ncbi:hypothetical protein LOC67_13485 [Stieleria sp. JC731]|uniref:hypothetical protein n=1 Tax=Pirellulaceae TaxID=2691357 RepID=UPI001E37DC19|nr:hypothetical protein [Stieleria sp. JC731]MCC9601564.1 hypothetical protein [Stieleria sp. JC731]
MIANKSTRRQGISLLEMVVAGTMITTIMMGLALVFRTAGHTWEVVDRDYAAERQISSVVRHFVRESREAASVISISNRGDQITLLMNDSSVRTWRRDENGEVQYQMNFDQAFKPLADGIEQLQFTGFDAAGVQVDDDPTDIQLVRIVARSQRETAQDASLEHESKVWIRTW